MHPEESLVPTLPQRVLQRISRTLGARQRLVRTLKHFAPDQVVFSLGGTYDLILYPDWISWLRKTNTSFRLVANWQCEHPQLSDSNLVLMRELFAAANRVYFVSTRNLQTTRRHLLAGLPNAEVIQNPLRWAPTDISPWPTSSRLQLATVSRLEDSKGIQLLLHALSTCAPSSDWNLDIYGIGAAAPYLRATADHLGLADRVVFRGFVPELRSIWTENHLMVSPSIDDGVPMTIPEAMLCERPVLATAVGGAEDWLRDGETGFICPAPTVPLLSKVLQQAFAVRHRWREMGQAASAHAQERYRSDEHLKLIA